MVSAAQNGDFTAIWSTKEDFYFDLLVLAILTRGHIDTGLQHGHWDGSGASHYRVRAELSLYGSARGGVRCRPGIVKMSLFRPPRAQLVDKRSKNARPSTPLDVRDQLQAD